MYNPEPSPKKTAIINGGFMFACAAVILGGCWVGFKRDDPRVEELNHELSILKSIDSQDEVTAGIQRKARIKAIEEELTALNNNTQND